MPTCRLTLLTFAAIAAVACARAVPVPQNAGDATDGPGASSATAGASRAGPGGGAPGRGAHPEGQDGPKMSLVVESDPTGPQGGAPPLDLPPVPAAEITEVDLAGLRAELARFKRAKRPVLVNYWATWCGPCVQELPELGEMARTWGDTGPAMLGVSLDRLTAADVSLVRGQVQQMLARARVSYPNRIIRGDQAKVLDALTVGDGIPVSILYDGAGREAARWAGGVNRESLAGAVRALGGASPPPAQTRGAAGGAGS